MDMVIILFVIIAIINQENSNPTPMKETIKNTQRSLEEVRDNLMRTLKLPKGHILLEGLNERIQECKRIINEGRGEIDKVVWGEYV